MHTPWLKLGYSKALFTGKYGRTNVNTGMPAARAAATAAAGSVGSRA